MFCREFQYVKLAGGGLQCRTVSWTDDRNKLKIKNMDLVNLKIICSISVQMGPKVKACQNNRKEGEGKESGGGIDVKCYLRY